MRVVYCNAGILRYVAFYCLLCCHWRCQYNLSIASQRARGQL
ncbi:hypothetical protein LTSEURB_2913, partial [Salmonella enterica subsp. enterica serovar Urbana str. R8-2977]